jgi:hypothetical protein
MPERTPALQAAVERVYSVFSRYPARPEMSYCTHCVDQQQAAALLATPLREIDAQLMDHYRWNATAETWGDWDDLKHFLPRMLDLISTGELPDYSPDMLFSSIGYQSRYWPDDERAAVRVYLDALINASAASFADEVAEALSIVNAAT